ncbi:MAG: primosomal protein N' [Lachnospiraceae bacterium]|nr:primosomal protein N' [Lachnospiraceae bacterium]
MYADIIVDISVESLDRSFQYRIPEELEAKAEIGERVWISFGNRKSYIKGYIVGISDRAKIDPSKIKPIRGIVEGEVSVDDRMIKLAAWMKENFGSTFNEALKCVIPIKKKVQNLVKRRILPKADRDILNAAYATAVRKKHKAKERLLFELLGEYEYGLDYSLVVQKLNVSAQTIQSLITEGLIELESETVLRNPLERLENDRGFACELNPSQKAVAESIWADLRAGIRNDYLIHGITGSGKTEVYMAVIDEVIRQGKQVIMLIPEIALTYQTVKRFYRRFGDSISIMNSKLSAGERYDQYLKAKQGLTQIVIGPRSAIFMPFDRLGLIIMDEEHESSYKSENSPKYSTRELALKRAEMEGASVILGSATPSLESYSAAKAGRIKLFELKERAGGAELPQIDVVDLREEMRSGNRSMFSRRLRELIEDRLSRNEQTMLFLNRRGHSSFVNCRECGKVLKCPHCDVSLTYHNNGRLMCHYCGYSADMVAKCPSCGSPYIKAFGIGTQKVEEQLIKEFPGIRVLRMDADTTRAKDGYEEILSAFANNEADILVGTQMIVKGHDFHNVTLVGILLADMSLYSSDFRSAERTYELLAQAAGRAGRGSRKGEVVIQTYNPEHYAIETAARNDYEAFYNEEMSFRKLLNYPPSWNMLRIMTLSEKQQCAERLAAVLKELIEKKKDEFGRVKVFGPAAAPVFKVNDVYRMHIYLKSADYSALVELKNYMSDYINDNPDKDTAVQFDFNPL